MSTVASTKKVGFSFALKWVVLTALDRVIATIAGILLAGTITVNIANLIRQPLFALFGSDKFDIFFTYVRIIINNSLRGLLIGLIIGCNQWLLLKKWLEGASRWFIALSIGETLGMVIIGLIIKFSIDRFVVHPGLILAIVVSPLIGLFVTLAQGSTLYKNNYPRKQWLIVAPMIGGVIQFFDPSGSLLLIGSPYLSAKGRATALVTGTSFLLIGSLFSRDC